MIDEHFTYDKNLRKISDQCEYENTVDHICCACHQNDDTGLMIMGNNFDSFIDKSLNV